MSGSGYRESPCLVRRGDGQTLQLTPLLYETLTCVDGSRTYEQIADALSTRIGRTASADNVRFLVEQKLRPLGLLAAADGTQPTTKRSNPLLALRFRVALTNAALTRRITLPFAWLFLPVLVIPLLGAFLVSTYWVLFDRGLASSAHQAFYTPGLLLSVFGLTLLSAGFHEFGHAAACRYGGASPGVMGFGLYIVWPAFYTDVSDSYRLNRRGRLWVDLGGLYFNCIFGVVAFGLWALTGWDALLLVIGTQVLQMLRQLTPVIRADGYHILSDLTGVPDLFAHIGPTLRSLIPFGRKRPRSPGALRRWAKVLVVLWVLVVVPMLAATLVLGVLMFPRLAATGWDSLAHQWHGFFVDKSHGEIPRMALRVLSMASVALPVLGIVVTVARMVRRTVSRTWQATAGRPRQQALAAVAAAAIVAGVAYAWWPGPHYQPIQPGERWTIPHVRDAVTPQAVSTSATSGEFHAARAVRPALILVPRQVPGQPVRPALIVTRTGTFGGAPHVLVVPPAPAGTPGGTESGWPFPWSPPSAARPGDNQAISINTKDGSALYDTAFSLVWVGDQPVYNRNQAIAYANCKFCQTVAIAFQAVFIVGSNHTSVPINTAEAANYHCLACQTAAVAVQLVATLNGMPDQQVVDRINELWKQLDTLQADLPHLSVTQITTRLNGLRDAILRTLVDSGSLLVQTADQAQARPATDTGSTNAQTSTPLPAPTSAEPTAAAASGETATPTPSASTPSSTTTAATAGTTTGDGGVGAAATPSAGASPAQSAPSPSADPVATATSATATTGG